MKGRIHIMKLQNFETRQMWQASAASINKYFNIFRMSIGWVYIWVCKLGENFYTLLSTQQNFLHFVSRTLNSNNSDVCRNFLYDDFKMLKIILIFLIFYIFHLYIEMSLYSVLNSALYLAIKEERVTDFLYDL